MSTIFDRNLLPEFESVRDSDEHILWSDKPKLMPFIFSGGKSCMVGCVIMFFVFNFSLFGGVFLNVLSFADKTPETSAGILTWIWYLFMGLILLAPFLVKVFSFFNTAYAFTNKRIMLRTGFIGTDFKVIDYDKISDIEVNVSVIERIFNVGTIRFFSGRTESYQGNTTPHFEGFCAIRNPYEVFRVVKDTIVDIKTDYNYPNALRPDRNPGYNSRYDRDR